MSDSIFHGGNDDDLIVGTDENDNLSGGAGSDILDGQGGDDKLTGGSSDDTLLGGDGNDILFGDSGADLLVGGAGDDELKGGAGVDTAYYEGSVFDYYLDITSKQTTVTDLYLTDGDEGTDVLTSIEAIEFGDGNTVYLDGRNNAAFTQSDNVETDEDTPLVIAATALIANDIDVEADQLTIVAVSAASHGEVSLGADGNITFNPDENFSGEASFQYTVSDGNGNLTTETVYVQVNAVADAPTVTISDASGNEDTAIALDIASSLTDTDGSETLSIEISGVPEGAVLSAGTKNSDGTYTLTAAQLSGLTVTPPSNSDEDFQLTVTATSTETSNGDTAQTIATLNVAVAAVADAPTVTVSDASGSEDAAIALDIASSLTDTDGSETLSIEISGVPEGAVLSAGTKNSDGTYTLTAAQLSGLTVTPPSNSDEDFQLTVTATSTETSNGETAQTSATLNVAVAAVTDGPLAVGPEFQVNTYTTNSQYFPKITSLADGGFVVTWTSMLQVGESGSIFAQLYDADGTKVGGEFLVNTYTNSLQFVPDITSLADGGFVVTWQSLTQDGSGYGIYGQRYDSNGAMVGPEFRVNTLTDGNQDWPAITGLADGGLVVTWESADRPGSSGIFAQRYDANGAILGREFQVNYSNSYDQYHPSIASLTDGGFVVTWETENWIGFDVWAQRYDADGAMVGREFQVNTFTSEGHGQRWPSITGLADGGFVVTWESMKQDGAGLGIFAQRYEADGAKVGDEFQVNTTTFGGQDSPSITSLTDGGFVITWSGYIQSGSTGIFAQQYDADGAKVGDEFQVNTYTGSYILHPDITTLIDGGFVVTWQSLTQDGSGYGIYGQRYATDFTGSQYDAELIADNGNDVLISGNGYDTMFGGLGADTFVFNSTEFSSYTISDFNAEEGDKVDLSALIDTSGDVSSYITLNSEETGTLMQIDVNQDNVVDQEIFFSGVDIPNDETLATLDFII